ncbi:MAG: hypothetical protein OEQ39_16160 [Gammaproteobacteria bacterium]|nr:hypothetical protein [Gammaproteobacteria bacterium]MDH3464932.1 hypothetical protein [Gammaproteobacteria bacterium]
MFKRTKEKFASVFLGDLVQDWGTVFRKDNFFEETIDIALYRKKEHWVVWLVYKYKSVISYNKYGFGIPVWDLEQFATMLQSQHELLRNMCVHKRYVTATRRDRLPFFHRLIIRAIHGLKASKLLLDHKDPVNKNTEYRFYGYITRKSAIKIFIQSDIDISKAHGHIISGEGLIAALCALSQFLEGQKNA